MLKKLMPSVLFVLFILLIPCLAHAQDGGTPSFDEKFGGWYLSADVMVGKGTFLDCNESFYDCFGTVEENRKIYEMFGTQRHAVAHDELADLGLLAHLHVGYLFGTRFFVSPEISVSGGFPMLLSVDARVRVVAPIVGGHAINAAIGVGYNIFDIASRSNDNIWDGLYLPAQIGYDYTFDNGFVIGVSAQVNLRFSENEKLKNYQAWKDSKSDSEIWKKDGVFSYAGFWGAGLYLGYRFGHHK